MYNALFGFNENADELLSMLNLTKEQVGRYRDCYLSKDGERIIVYTRNGGGNRDDYEEVFQNLSTHPNYITDYDDDYDCTYASIEFSIPDEHKQRVSEIFKDSDTSTGAEKFDKLFKEMSENPTKVFSENERVRNVTENLQSAFEDPTNKGGILFIDNDGSVERKDLNN